MSYYLLDERLYFPPLSTASNKGLIAIGGDLSPERLALAYSEGIFPWYSEDEPILWWSPDPRFVLYPQKLKVSKSTRVKMRKTDYRLEINSHFQQVMENCQSVYRPGQDGTWINDEMVESYTALHRRGMACSASLWEDSEMIAGLYGIRQGRVFCGESMFHTVTDASKICFARYVQWLIKEGVELIDCQIHSQYLESLGAEFIPRSTFIEFLHP